MASTLVERLNAKESKAAEQRAMASADPYALYEQRKLENTKFEVKFSGSDKEGNLFTYDTERKGRIRLFLPMEKLQESDRFYSAWNRSRYIGIRTLEVLVDRIDKENGTVYLKSGRVTTGILNAIRKDMQKYVMDKYEQEKSGETAEPYEVHGTVVSVDENRTIALVQLFHQDLFAVIHVKEWAKTYTRSIPEGIENDDTPMAFTLIGTSNYKGQHVFRLSRKDYNYEQWNAVEDLEEGGLVIVECVELPKESNRHWWGKTQGFDVEVMGNYNPHIKMEVGRSYACKIKKLDRENHLFIVTPFNVQRKDGAYYT